MWEDNGIVSAIETVKAGQSTIAAAASRRISVPRKTLDDLIIKGRVTNDSKFRLSTALTPIEEDTLISYPIYMANCGFPLTRTMVKALHGQLQRDMESVIDFSWSMDRG